MGITGLLPFLEKSSRRTNIKEFKGGCVAIDTYCWLHKGIFSCADKLSMGQSTDAYVRYCIRFIQMLLGYNIKPILVFDGQHLPAKAETESKRRELRKSNRQKALELIKIGQVAEGRSLLKRCIDVTHEMALELIKYCQQENIDCIVAPYEADAQLAYLNINNIADVVITEDSDLTLFGCNKIFFKMDIDGNGVLVESNKLHLSMGLREDLFQFDMFLHMCILSGCDYLQSLPGIGLTKAKKFVLINGDSDIQRTLPRIGSYLNMKSLRVPIEYTKAFMRAVITFKHQLVFCPMDRKQVRLTPVTTDVSEEDLKYAGSEAEQEVALNLALGNIDPITKKVLHNYNPDQLNICQNGTKKSFKHKSIWSKDCIITGSCQLVTSNVQKKLNSSFIQMSSFNREKIIHVRNNENTANVSATESINDNEILSMYTSNANNKINSSNLEESSSQKENYHLETDSSKSESQISPILIFKKRSRLRTKNMSGSQRTVVDENDITESKFFSKTAASDVYESEKKDSHNNEIIKLNDSEEKIDYSSEKYESIYNEFQAKHTEEKIIKNISQVSEEINLSVVGKLRPREVLKKFQYNNNSMEDDENITNIITLKTSLQTTGQKRRKTIKNYDNQDSKKQKFSLKTIKSHSKEQEIFTKIKNIVNKELSETKLNIHTESEICTNKDVTINGDNYNNSHDDHISVMNKNIIIPDSMPTDNYFIEEVSKNNVVIPDSILEYDKCVNPENEFCYNDSQYLKSDNTKKSFEGQNLNKNIIIPDSMLTDDYSIRKCIYKSEDESSDVINYEVDKNIIIPDSISPVKSDSSQEYFSLESNTNSANKSSDLCEGPNSNKNIIIPDSMSPMKSDSSQEYFSLESNNVVDSSNNTKTPSKDFTKMTDRSSYDSAIDTAFCETTEQDYDFVVNSNNIDEDMFEWTTLKSKIAKQTIRSVASSSTRTNSPMQGRAQKLKNKKTTNQKQQSLLSMFGFKNKPKLNC